LLGFFALVENVTEGANLTVLEKAVLDQNFGNILTPVLFLVLDFFQVLFFGKLI